MIRSLPIRWRLTLWYMMLTLFVLGVFSTAVYVGLDRRLSSQLDEDLRSQAALAAGAVTLGRSGAIFESHYKFSDESLLRVINLDGRVISSYRGTEALSASPPRQMDLERASSGRTSYSTFTYEDQKLRVITVPITDANGSVLGALQVGYSMNRVENPLKFMFQALLVIAPVAILIAAATGYMLAGNALRPVAKITTLASQIDGDDLQLRLNLDLPNDELGRLASTFDLMLERIEDAFLRQRQFTGDAAHELRTPLALMRSQIDLAVTQADTVDEFREALSALDGDVVRMTSLVSTLLSLARVDAGQMQPNREQVDLADLAGDVAEQLQVMAEEQGLTIVTRLIPITVQADADMLIQVLVNLVDNAIKNTPAGGVIGLHTWTDGRMAHVSVADTGVGIAAEHLPRIFDRFYRVDSGRTRSRGGIGLGLAICQAIANTHNGSLTAISTPGKGSTFTLTLPLEPAVPAARKPK